MLPRFLCLARTKSVLSMDNSQLTLRLDYGTAGPRCGTNRMNEIKVCRGTATDDMAFCISQSLLPL